MQEEAGGYKRRQEEAGGGRRRQDEAAANHVADKGSMLAQLGIKEKQRRVRVQINGALEPWRGFNLTRVTMKDVQQELTRAKEAK